MKERLLRWLYHWAARQLGMQPQAAASLPPQEPVLPVSRYHSARLPRQRSPLSEPPREWHQWNP